MTAPKTTEKPDTKFSEATITLTPDAKEGIDESRLNRDALLTAINTGLRSHDLINDRDDTHTRRALRIVISNFVVRPASNAALFGYMLSNATLAGHVEVRDTAGLELGRFKIKAHARLAAPVTAEPVPQPLDDLYKNFADLTISKLTGVPIKRVDTDVPR